MFTAFGLGEGLRFLQALSSLLGHLSASAAVRKSYRYFLLFIIRNEFWGKRSLWNALLFFRFPLFEAVYSPVAIAVDYQYLNIGAAVALNILESGIINLWRWHATDIHLLHLASILIVALILDI